MTTVHHQNFTNTSSTDSVGGLC